jgi:hypothetical protein
VIGPAEKEAIERSNVVPTSKGEWGCYPPDSVVFLLMSGSELQGRIIQERAEHNYEISGAAFLLKIEGEFDVEDDCSAAGWTGSVIHRGPIALDGVAHWIEAIPRRFENPER